MRRNWLFLLLAGTVAAVAPVAAMAQTIDISNKPHVAVNAEKLKRIDSLMQTYVDKGWIKGVVTLMVKDNHVVQYKGYGYADAEARRPMTKDAIFRIASQSKAITSVGLMMLYEQGRFTLDEPIADFIPEFRHPMVLSKYNAADTTYTAVPAKREITFRDLLTHTSGIDYSDIGTPTGTAIYAKAGIPPGLHDFDVSLLEKMKILAKQPLMFQPGEKWQYGLNTDLVGCLIEVMSGMTLEDYLHKNLFAPLGMKDTYFNLPAAKANRLTAVYTENDRHEVIKWPARFRQIDAQYPLVHKNYFSGGAGLSSTAFDYAVFMQMLLNGGVYNGHRILSPRTVQLMTSNQLDFTYNGADNFGLGFSLTSAKSALKNARYEGAYGWGGYFGTVYWADPKAGLVCLYMIQQTPNSHYDLETKFEQIVYSSLLK